MKKLGVVFKIAVLIGLIATFGIILLLPKNLPPYFLLLLYFLIISLSSYYLINHFVQNRIKKLFNAILRRKTPNKAVDNIDTTEEIVNKWISENQAEIQQLKDTEKFRREFLGNVSHELKTPIFNIQGYILTLLDGALEEKEINRKYLERSQKNVERMISIVEDLESISKLESNSESLNIQNWDIVLLCSNIIDSMEDKANEYQIVLELQNKYNQILVKADENKIGQVLTNLIDNSIKYGKSGGTTKISFQELKNKIFVNISDNGIGIEENHIPRLFERFYRVDASRSQEIGGTGLGLSIVKHILEAHHQSMSVSSRINEGSTFSFSLEKGK